MPSYSDLAQLVEHSSDTGKAISASLIVTISTGVMPELTGYDRWE